MKKESKLLFYTVIATGVFFICRYFKNKQLNKQKQLALTYLENGKLKEAISVLETLLYDINDEGIRNLLVKSLYEDHDYNKTIKYSQNDNLVLFDCYYHMKNYRKALFHLLMHYELKNDLVPTQDINKTLDACVKESLGNHKVEKMSLIVYVDFFDTFPFLFDDFIIKKRNKRNNTQTNSVKIKSITEIHFKSVKTYFMEGDFEKLGNYISEREDNLSIFIKISLKLIELRKHETIYKEEMLHIEWKTCLNKKYEEKIYTYCKALIDYKNQKIVDYDYEDISTHFYKIKCGTTNKANYINKFSKQTIHSFVYYQLIQENNHLVENALSLFPRHKKILFMAFSIFVSNRKYDDAERVLEKMKLYYKDDPRTYLCRFLHQKNKYDKHDIDLLIEGYKIDPIYYKTSVLLWEYYYEYDDDNIAYSYLKKAIDTCNDTTELYALYKAYILHEVKYEVLDKL